MRGHLRPQTSCSLCRRLDVARAKLATLPRRDKAIDSSGRDQKAAVQPEPVMGAHPALETPLYTTVKARVNAYFARTRLPSRGGPLMLGKALLLIALTFA